MPKGGYGKKPWWYWLLIYVVVGGAVYALIYMLFLKSNGGYGY